MYNIKDLNIIESDLETKISRDGGYFYNDKEYYLKGIEKSRQILDTGIFFKELLDSIQKYNLLSTYPYSVTTSTGTILIDGVSYDSTIVETSMGRVGDKVRFKVCNTYTIDDEETTTCEYIDKDIRVSNNCLTDCEDTEALVNRFQVFSNPTN